MPVEFPRPLVGSSSSAASKEAIRRREARAARVELIIAACNRLPFPRKKAKIVVDRAGMKRRVAKSGVARNEETFQRKTVLPEMWPLFGRRNTVRRKKKRERGRAQIFSER